MKAHAPTAILQVGAQEKYTAGAFIKQVRDDIQKQAKLEYVAGAHMAKVQGVKDWMAEVKKKAIRGVPRSREYGKILQTGEGSLE